MQPIVLTIAGSDSSGGAGIQADLKAIAACGGYGASVITAITAQNTVGVNAVDAIPVAMIRSQIDAVFDDLPVAACKTGMLASKEIVGAVARGLEKHMPRHYVCDPVMISKSGHTLLADHCIDALLAELVPRATLLTPNAHEAERLTGQTVRTPAGAERAGRELVARGAHAVLVKGGHLSEHRGTDVLATREGVVHVEGEWIETAHTHGTGCTYSAAIATLLAHGLTLERAVRRAKWFLTEAIRAGWAVGEGHGPTDPFFFLRGASQASSAWTAFLANPSADLSAKS